MRTAAQAARPRRGSRPVPPVRSGKALRPAPLPPPPTYQEHAVTLRLHHHVYELAVWAFRYEQAEDDEFARLHQGRTFEQFLEGCIEEGLESTVHRWEAHAG